jgi:hypothetical protein
VIPKTETETEHQNQTEEADMAGSIDTNTAGIYALLADTARAGNGRFGAGGGEGGNGGLAPWAGPGANAQRILGVESTVNQQADCINGTLESLTRTLAGDATNKNIADGFSRVCEGISDADRRNTDGQFRQEIRAQDRATAALMQTRLDDITRQGHAAEVKNVEQFCELKAGQAVILAEVKHNKEYGELFTENAFLKSNAACGCGCRDNHHGHHGRG